MKRRAHKSSVSISTEQWRAVSSAPSTAFPSIEFDYWSLARYQNAKDSALISGTTLLAGVPWKVSPDWRPTIDLFKLSRSDHAFATSPLGWGFRLTEPQITRTIAHLLDKGPPDIRAERTAAFLQALGIQIGNLKTLQDCRIIAEEDRIDLKIVWDDGVLAIECKLGHHVTKGQLERYRKAVSSRHPKQSEHFQHHFVLLALNEKALGPLKKPDRARWTYHSWKSFWFLFERSRPQENDLMLSMFQMTLWDRIDRLCR